MFQATLSKIITLNIILFIGDLMRLRELGKFEIKKTKKMQNKVKNLQLW